MLTLKNLKSPKGTTRNTKRIGRGEGSGQAKQAGKGHKGQTARSGGGIALGFEGGQMPLYRRIPKRGFTNIHRRTNAVLNLSDLARIDVKSFGEITLESLVKSNFVKGRFDRLTILASGELNQAVSIKAHRISEAAQEKIKKAGGKFELLPIPEGKKRTKSK